MSRILSTILFTLIAICTCTAASTADTYQVTRTNAPAIKIKGKVVQAGQKFSAADRISWDTSNGKVQIIECKNLRTGAICRFSNKQFQVNQSSSIKDFYLRINKASTRDASTEKVAMNASTEKGKFSDRRIALVLGNSCYKSLPYLRNAMTDAAEISNKLQTLGFDVVEGYECGYGQMRTLLESFTQKAKNYNTAVIYYSGHGVQEKGVNYLVPIDCPLEARSQLMHCVSANDFVDKLDEAGCATKIIFLDACRNVKTSWTRSAGDGLATMEASPGMVVAFSTQSGKYALDGDGDFSPFADALLKNIDSNASFSDMMTNVVKQTYASTNHQQYPVTMGNLITDFRFNAKGSDLPKVEDRPAPASTQKPTIAEDAKSEDNAPSMTFDNPLIDTRITQIRRTGTAVSITCVFTNNSGKTLSPKWTNTAPPFSPAEESTLAYDNTGEAYYSGEKVIVYVGSDTNAQNAFSLPIGVPVKLSFVIRDVPRNATSISLLQVSFRDMGTAEYYGKAMLIARNLPLPK